MNRHIKQVAILGSGVMGSRIACHFANIGVKVLLLDIVPKELNDAEKRANLQLTDKKVRNRIVNDALSAALKSNPSPIYRTSFASNITTGNFDDNMKDISSCDWIIEVVVERADIKKSVFAQVEKFRKPGTIVSTNTSGIPISVLTEDRSEDFVKHFCGTHFFNPPRYLKLLEIIPGKKTDPSILEFLEDYGSRFLGKTTVLCKDTPAFIANRVGVFSIQALFHSVQKFNLKVEDVDKLTGPLIGRPKSATFRTCDVVGIDTLVHVANGVRENCPNDEQNALFKIPGYLEKMVANGWIGDKNKQGFYKKTKNEKGETEILSLNLDTLEYGPQQKTKFKSLEQTKTVDDLVERTRILYDAQDLAGEFFRHMFHSIFAYVSHRIPEIADHPWQIDNAMKAGFGWELGPFETWEQLGLEKVISSMEASGFNVAPWVKNMVNSGQKSFFTVKDTRQFAWNPGSSQLEAVPGSEQILNLQFIPADKTVWSNSACVIRDLGDGILCLSWKTKMNTIGGEVLQGVNKAIDLAEQNYKGLVIYNNGDNFSAGANVAMIFMLAAEQELEELDIAVRTFQKTVMRLRYSSIPVVVAPHNLTLGGSCEMCLHADAVVAHAELYMGLVEFGVGVIPGGGGTKEFALRTSDEISEGDIRINALRRRFLTIGQARVSTSAHEAFDLGYLRPGIDEVIVSRSHQLNRAKEVCLGLVERGYSIPVQRKDIQVLGNEGLGIVYAGANTMRSGNYISDHDQLISEKLGFVLCGGDLSASIQVSEQYLLDLERKVFIELCMQKKSLERMQSLLTTGKILRN